MVIEKGQPWGQAAPKPERLRTAHSDRELGRLLTSDLVTPITVRSGDLFKALGAPVDRQQMQRLPLDLLQVYLDDEASVAVAHVTIYKSLWRGPLLGVFNVSDFNGWNAAPKAHPNDGRFDVIAVDAAFGFRQRWAARSRLPNGTHVPHPNITQTRATEIQWRFEEPRPVRIDGDQPIKSRHVRVVIEPDSYELYI